MQYTAIENSCTAAATYSGRIMTTTNQYIIQANNTNTNTTRQSHHHPYQFHY